MTESAQLPAYRRVWVDSQPALEEVTATLSSVEAIGIDAEMVQRARRYPGGLQEWTNILSLIQVAGGNLSAVIDPLRCTDLSPLRPLLAGPVRKVFLGGGQDDALLAQAGIPPRNVVDVGEIALSLFGRKEDGMAALSQRIFGLSLDKTIRRADWHARPLNPVLVAYAHRDAELTLGIYDWMKQQHPDVVHFHERVELDPALPKNSPPWLQAAFSRPAQDIMAVIAEFELDAATDAERLSADLDPLLRRARAPRVVNRLLRIAGDLELHPTLPLALRLARSPSSMIRSSAARAIGFLAEPDEGVPILKELLEDPISDVKKAAQMALGDIKNEPTAPPEDADEPPTSLGGDALAALEQLRARLEQA